MASIRQSTEDYEAWLRKQLAGDVVEKDLARKHDKMKESPFAFLRATYWRWAEIAMEVCPDAADAPHVLAVGDIHLENFGTWRDVEGRLVWGVNDFDEAAEMPYVLDLIRLAASALVAGVRRGVAAQRLGTALLEGYRQGLAAPSPVILDRDRQWLRELVVVSEKQRAKFWEKIEAAKTEPAPRTYRDVLAAAMPEAETEMRTARRSAGAGSLGRPRWIGIAEWRGAPVVREAKPLIASSWYRVAGRGRPKKLRGAELARGRYRAHDPWYHVKKGIVVRRLSPNNRKVEAEKDAAVLLSPDMLQVMGFELANVHLAGAGDGGTIERDLRRRKGAWLLASAENMAAAVRRDFQEWAAP